MTAQNPLWLVDEAPIMGGAERFALRLSRYARERGRPVAVVCPPGALARACAEAGIPVRELALPRARPWNLMRMVAAARRLRRAVLGEHPRPVVVANTASTQALTALAAIGRPRLSLVHLLHEQDTARRRSARRVLPRSGAVVAIGSNAARTYRAALPGVEIGVANNFVDPDAWPPPHAPQEPPVLGVVGRLIPEKGVLELVGELAECPELWQRTLVAAPVENAPYARRVGDAISAAGLGGRFELLGAVEDMRAFYAGIDALVLPSTGTEGQPTAILEALASGLPVLARAGVLSADFDGLAVRGYDTARELAQALRTLPPPTAPPPRFHERFGPAQALDALDQAALRVSPLA